MKVSFGILAIFWAGIAITARAQTPLGDEFQVNTGTGLDQIEPTVAFDAGGRSVVVWSGGGRDGDGLGVNGQLFDASGARSGGEFQINSFVRSDQEEPDVAMHADGSFVVVWSSEEFYFLPGDDEGGIRAQRYDSDGTAAGAEFRVNTYTTGQQYEPSVAMDVDAAGGFVVVWSSDGQDGSIAGVHGQRFDASGGTLASEFQVNTYTTNQQFEPAVAAHSSGQFVVVWVSYGQDGSYNGVFGQRFDPLGAASGGEFQVHTSTAGFQGHADVALDAEGNFVVVWLHGDGPSDFIHGRRFDASGAPLGGEFPVNSDLAGSLIYPRVALHPEGHAVVVWQNIQSFDDETVRARLFDSAGAAIGEEFRVNSLDGRLHTLSAVEADATGQFVVAWSSYAGGARADVLGKRYCFPFDLGGSCLFSDGFESGTLSAWSSSVN